ncbi:MAG: hypothetical protein JNM45_11380 [Rhizobiales bacterium]|nr:hypothetical protein [Hyphomicrobiales bacterium]
MRLSFAALALAAFAACATPAQATECVSDLIKAREYIQHAQLDRGTRRYAEMLWGKASVYKMDGKFELCNSTTRQLMHVLGLE